MTALGFLKKQNTVTEIPLEDIRPNPFQPRKTLDENELSRLCDSIRENGLIQPIAVRRIRDGYELVAGERRLRALQKLGRKTAPALIYDLDDEGSAAWALIENLQRSDLGVFEEAEGIARLLAFWGLSQEAAAKRLGVAPSTLSNKLRLLRLSPKTRQILEEASLSERHARELLRLSTEEEQKAAADVVAKRNLSVAETERYVSSLLAKKERRPSRSLYVVKDVRLFINTFEHAMDVMNSAGIGAVSTVSESEDAFVYTVRIPKTTALREKRPKTPSAPAYPACTPSVI